MDFLFDELYNNLKIFAFITVFFTIETFWPYLVKVENRPKHTTRNIGLLLFYIIITTPVNYVAAAWYNYIDEQHWGLLSLFSIHPILKIILGILLLDCGDYFYHRLSHNTNLIWRFHKIHHSDMEMDVTTTYRFHPFDNIGLTMTEMTTAAIFGYGVDTIIVYFTIYLPLLFIQHTNLKFPNWFEKVFGYVFATADFHRVHHSYPQHFTDSNYGAVFSFWDRLFGTYQRAEIKNFHFGLEDAKDNKYQTLWHLISGPFRNS
jgi:sterol desaturase/sphingolipid hydroxylase (fatty acid hydroxylase superfamily)